MISDSRCEKMTEVNRRYGQKLGKTRCTKPAVLQSDSGQGLCHKHFNSWFKKVNPEDYNSIVQEEKTTPAIFYLSKEKPE